MYLLWLLLCLQGDSLRLDLDEVSSMTMPIWATWLYDSGNWIIVPTRNEDGAVTIRKWDRQNKISVLGRTGPREGIMYASFGALDEKGVLYLRGMVSPNVLMLDTRNPRPRFKKYGSAIDLNGEYFVHQGLLIGGAYNLHLKAYEGNLSEPFSGIARRLPDAKHPSLGHDNRQKMLLEKTSTKLVIAYTLYDEFSVIDLKNPPKKPKFQKLRFRGYVRPDDIPYPKKYSDKKEMAYMSKIHHLHEVSIFKDRAYGRFRQGFDGYGIWVDLLDPVAFTYDNNKNDKKIVAISEEELVLGSVHETDDGGITWKYWRSSSLP